ncbi:MAG: primosomal replication protein N [Rubrivivax sp.]
MNRLVLSAALVERGGLRSTPAGVPVLDLALKHESQLGEAGLVRSVSMHMKAIAIGEITRTLAAMTLGQVGIFAGFLAAARNGRGLLFHVTTVDLPAA